MFQNKLEITEIQQVFTLFLQLNITPKLYNKREK